MNNPSRLCNIPKAAALSLHAQSGVPRKVYVPTVPRQCIQCGGEFRAWPAKVSLGQAVFCSRRCKGLHKRVTPAERLVRDVDRHGHDGCWLWRGTLNPYSGYGQFVHLGKNIYAHRAAYEHFVGPIPNGLTIDHLCRNRWCVNPAHLEPVTQRENTHRGLVMKLTPTDVAAIRQLHAEGLSQLAIGRRFGVSGTHVGHIVSYQRWAV